MLSTRTGPVNVAASGVWQIPCQFGRQFGSLPIRPHNDGGRYCPGSHERYDANLAQQSPKFATVPVTKISIGQLR